MRWSITDGDGRGGLDSDSDDSSLDEYESEDSVTEEGLHSQAPVPSKMAARGQSAGRLTKVPPPQQRNATKPPAPQRSEYVGF